MGRIKQAAINYRDEHGEWPAHLYLLTDEQADEIAPTCPECKGSGYAYYGGRHYRRVCLECGGTGTARGVRR